LRALEILHYFHGVNPLAMVYLTNMYALGASNSANEIFHLWFGRYSSDSSAKFGALMGRLGLDTSGVAGRWPDFRSRWSDALTSACGPPPGYVPGGPNQEAVRDGVPEWLRPPAGQPAQKSYKDWNADWPESSWSLTEPAIYTQAAYVKLLSTFAQ
jgi:hypothetical protein